MKTYVIFIFLWSHFIRLLDGGNLFERIFRNKRVYSENEVMNIIRQILSALAHCNASGIVHRDLKLENVMYITNEINSEIKLVDFGLSNKIKNLHRVKALVGSPMYMPPEVLEGIPGGIKSDIYSVGILQYFLLKGTFPFSKARNLNELKEQVLNHKFSFDSFNEFKGVSNECKLCMLQMLTYDFKMRPSAEELLKHQWFKQDKTISGLSIENQEVIFQNICSYRVI